MNCAIVLLYNHVNRSQMTRWTWILTSVWGIPMHIRRWEMHKHPQLTYIFRSEVQQLTIEAFPVIPGYRTPAFYGKAPLGHGASGRGYDIARVLLSAGGSHLCTGRSCAKLSSCPLGSVRWK